ncbi:hypothetical protein ACMDB5_09735 [Flavobacterium sp. W1B]|uniref:hypothetical protein n=1 Tax=Flavobacterium sp. W1B TaxID=3394146 RepID=UPI0039BD886B
MKLSLDALKERAEAIASEELLGTISGGLEEACHDVKIKDERDKAIIICDNI